jgi:hypothetical protein
MFGIQKKKTLKVTPAFKFSQKALHKFYGRGNVPSLNFIGANDSLHSIFVPPTGHMIYLTSTQEEMLDQWEVTEVYMSLNHNTNGIRLVLATPLEGLYMFMELGGEAPTVYQVGPDFLTKFKREYSYCHCSTDMITSTVHDFIKRNK